MLASTTIKKDSISRKKAKEARELENIKRLLESENPLNEEERGSSTCLFLFFSLCNNLTILLTIYIQINFK